MKNGNLTWLDFKDLVELDIQFTQLMEEDVTVTLSLVMEEILNNKVILMSLLIQVSILQKFRVVCIQVQYRNSEERERKQPYFDTRVMVVVVMDMLSMTVED